MAVNSIYSNTIRFSGLATGLDTDKIVKELMNAHRIPLVRLQQQRQLLEWQKEAYREVNRLMTSFRDAVAPLRLQSTFQVKTAYVNNTSVADVKASGNAFEGTYSITVQQLARGASLTGQSLKKEGMNVTKETRMQDLLGSGELPQEIYLNGVKIELDEDMTVDSFVKAVNDKTAETGVRVSFDTATQRFFFMTVHTGTTWTKEGESETRYVKIDFFDKGGGERIDYDEPLFNFLNKAVGIDERFLLDESGNRFLNPEDFIHQNELNQSEEGQGVADPRKMLVGQNARIIYQGAELEFTSNHFSVNGLNIQLKGTGEMTVTVSPDVDAVFNAIKKFVEEYNKLVDEVNKKLQEPRYRDYAPLTQEQKDEMTEKEIELWEERAKSGMLRNDSMLVSILSQFRTVISSFVESSRFKTLSAISIDTGSYYERGKLVIKDETKLRDLISQNLEEVMKLFVINDPNDESKYGIGKRLYDLADKAVKQLEAKAGNLLSYSLADNSTLGKRIKELDERISQMQNRLIAIEQRYWAQFTALERAIARMNMQSAWLAQTFGGGQ